MISAALSFLGGIMPSVKRRAKRSSPRQQSREADSQIKSGFMVVQLRPTPEPMEISRLEAIPAIASLLQAFDVKPSNPLINSLELGELRQREKEWKLSPEKSLSGFWRLDLRHLMPDRIEELKNALQKLPTVSLA